jgi:hypothetical protein
VADKDGAAQLVPVPNSDAATSSAALQRVARDPDAVFNSYAFGR